MNDDQLGIVSKTKILYSIKNFINSTLHGAFWYLLIQIVGALVLGKDATFSKPQQIILTIIVGPFFYIPYLVYPLIITATSITTLLLKRKKIPPSFILSSYIIYALVSLYAGYVLKSNVDVSNYLIFIKISAFSCLAGYIYSKYNPLNRKN